MALAARQQPLYAQLVDTLREKIDNDMKPGDLLPSERDLSLQYNLSRTTVRLALGELEALGAVIRKHGKGTFVADTSSESTNLISAYSFTEQMKEQGRTPTTKILDFRIVEAKRNVAENLHLPQGSKIYAVRRLRLADNVPMMVGVSYLPYQLFPNLSLEALVEHPLYEIFEKAYNQVIHIATEECSASLCRMEEARALGLEEGVPVLRFVRNTSNNHGQIIEYTRSVARGDRFKYVVTHVRNE